MWAPRLSYSLFIMDLPPLRKSSRMKTVMLKLASLYPHNCRREQVLLYRNGNKRQSWLVFVFASNPEKKRMGISCLTVLKRAHSFAGTVYFLTDSWIETLQVSSGSLVSSEVSTREKGMLPEMRKNSTAFFAFPADINRIIAQRLEVSPVLFPIDRVPRFFTGTVWMVCRSKREHVKNVLIAIAFILILGGCGFRLIRLYTDDLRVAAENRRISEDRERAAIENKEKQRLHLEELEQQYAQSAALSAISAYSTCSIIYECLGSETLIDTMSIAGNTFQLDAHDTDSLAVLHRFEKNRHVLFVRMNRTAQNNGREYFSISGELKQSVSFADSSLAVREQIDYYESILEKEVSERAINASRSPASFAGGVRKLLANSSCVEEYLQYIQSGVGIELECSVRASGRNFLRFLQQAESTLEFSAVRIKNNAIQNEVSAFVRIETGIPAVMVEKELLAFTQTEPVGLLQPEEISRIFYVPVSPLPVVKSVPIAESTPEKAHIIKNPVFLQYLGTAGISRGKQYVFIKNTRDNVLHKLPLDSDEEHSSRLVGDNLVEVRLGREVYEVHK